MRSRAGLVLLLVTCLALVSGCDLQLSPTRSASFLLAPGQIARVQDVRVRFVGVISDTRCPANVTCVTAGDAVVVFELRTDTVTAEAELHVVDPAKRSAVFESYIIELMALGPYPVAGQTISHDDYRAAISIRRE